MSYKLTFSLTNVTLGDLADFIEAAQELGAPDSAVLQFEGDQVIVEVGESTSSSSARSASDAENAYGTSTSGPRFSANNFGSNVEDTFRRLQSEPAVQDFSRRSGNWETTLAVEFDARNHKNQGGRGAGNPPATN